MDKQNVLISTTTYQRDIDPEPMKAEYRGSLYEKNGARYVRYEIDGVQNLVRFTHEEVEVTRTGAAHSKMVFRRGERTKTLYDTGSGALDMEIVTRDIRVSEHILSVGDHSTGDHVNIGHDITIELIYDLEIGGQHATVCELRMEIHNGI